MGTKVGGEFETQRSPSRMRRVLVIDAYASGRRTICMCIAELGHVALEAETADRASVIAASSAVDLIIASCDDDVSLSLLAELHARNPALPTLMLSTFAERTTKIPENAVRLVEPLTLETLERAIEVMSREMRSPIGRS